MTMDAAALQKMVDACPFHRLLGLEVTAVDSDQGRVSLALDLKPEFSRSDGRVELHGGVTASLIDIAGDYAVAALIGRGVPTISLRIDYLRMGRGRRVEATAVVRRAGRTIGTVDIEVFDDAGTLIALGRGTYSTA